MNELSDEIDVQIEKLLRASLVLEHSYRMCLPYLNITSFTIEQEDAIEAFTSRFGRLADIFLQNTLKLIDEIDLETQGTVKDRINRALKKGIIEDEEQMIRIRKLRNKMAHEYILFSMEFIFSQTVNFTPQLLKDVKNAVDYLTNSKFNLH